MSSNVLWTEIECRSVPVREVLNRSNCWVALPVATANEILTDDVEFPVVLRLWDAQHRSPIGRVCWMGETNQTGCLEISNHVCSILEITDGQQLTLEVNVDIPIAERLVMRCVSLEDYRLMHIESAFFEEEILKQGALVTSHQLLPVWLRHQKLPMHLMPMEIVPSVSFVRITNATEMEIHAPVDVRPIKDNIAAVTDPKPTAGNRKLVTRNSREQRNAKRIFSTEITEEGSSSEIHEGTAHVRDDGPSRHVSTEQERHLRSDHRSKSETARQTSKKRSKSSNVRERRRCVLRLQRPDEAALKLTVAVPLNTDAESKLAFLKPDAKSEASMFSSWFPSNVSISTSLSTVMFVHPASAIDAGLKAGEYVVVSRRKMKNKPPWEKSTVLRLLFSNAVSSKHCILHDMTASEIGVRYCQSVFVMAAHPEAIHMDALSEIIFRPMTPVSAPSSRDDQEKEKTRTNERPLRKSKEKPQPGVPHLKQLLSRDLKLHVFTESPLIEEEKLQPSKGSPLYDLVRMTMAYWNMWLPILIDDREVGTPLEDGSKTKRNSMNGALDLFLRTLLRSWIDAQLNASWNIHRGVRTNVHSVERSSVRRHTHRDHFHRFCLPPQCLIHIQFCTQLNGEARSVSIPLSLKLRLGLEDDLPKEGCLIDIVGLRVALRQQKVGISVADVEALALDGPEPVTNNFLSHQLPPWLKQQAETCVEYVKPALGTVHPSTSDVHTSVGILISGSTQNGKTSFVSGICQRLAYDRGILAHVCYIPCRLLWSFMTESFGKFSKEKARLYRDMATAIASSPSVIVFDDVDCWCASHEEQESLNLNSKRAVSVIKDIMEQIRSKGVPIVFLVTTSDLKNIDESLLEPGCLDYHLRMPDLNTAIRGDMLRCLFQETEMQLHPDGMDSWDAGLEFADLERLVSRVMHEHIHIRRKEDNIISKDALQSALMDFKPAAQWKITREQDTGGTLSGLDDVGGMADVKAVLHDCIELPIKFPELMQQCPLRLMSNILLYGPPGSGKTFIVGALKTSLDVRLVSVKGPELLNKYVGQSEAAVRATFKSAVEAAPCILFFDEFEALGRHRGSDTSGILDRVVNQLLTEMDGVESLTGVCIIAATSRPDLIDKALLRPGRLDRHVYCPLPSKSERLEILKILSKNQTIDDGIDLEWMADNTDGYSGADLTSIISEAHLHAVSHHLKTQASSGAIMPIITIAQADISYAMEQSRPSSSDKEKHFLSEIYSNFSSGKVCMSLDNPGFKGLTYA